MAQALEGAGGLCTSTQALKRGQAERAAEERLVDLARCLDEFGVPQRDGLLCLIGSAHGAQLTSSRGRSTRGDSVARAALLVRPNDAASPTGTPGLRRAPETSRSATRAGSPRSVYLRQEVP